MGLVRHSSAIGFPGDPIEREKKIPESKLTCLWFVRSHIVERASKIGVKAAAAGEKVVCAQRMRPAKVALGKRF